MESKQEKGKRGEDLAACFLTGQGYTLLQRRYRKRGGEIDLICRQNDTLVFVEVKARTTGRYGTPAEAVNRRKQRALTLAALSYMHQKGLSESPCRFDVVEVDLRDGQIRHIKDAFWACLPG